MRRPTSPARFLARHEYRAYLKAKGITANQLTWVAFGNIHAEFSDWRPISKTPWPANFDADLRVWTTLHWLILSDPPPSRDRREAWELVANHFKQIADTRRNHQTRARPAQTVANGNRKAAADGKAIMLFRDWEADMEHMLGAKSPAQRLDLFIKVKDLPERQQRRLRRLFKARQP